MAGRDGPFEGLRPHSYSAILADPPWHFRARTALQVGNWTSRRDSEKHYRVMGVDDIAALPVKDMAAADAHLFLWVTGPMLVQGSHLAIMQAWGFRPSAVAFTWIKLKRSFNALQLRVLPTLESDLHVGLGLISRKNGEFGLLGRRGNCKRTAKDVRDIIMAP